MIIIPAQLESFRTLKDKSLKVTFETQELNPQELLGIMENLNAFGFMSFKPTAFTEQERRHIEGLEPDIIEGGKTDSQRLKAVLYRMWEKDNEGFDTSARHYAHHMEKIIKHFKSKLDI